MKGSKSGRPALDPQIAAMARKLRTWGYSWTRIARELGIGRTTARDAVLGRHDALRTAKEPRSLPPESPSPTEAENVQGGGTA
jgi:hypothetical protein